MGPSAHAVPAEHRWIELSDGRVTVYDVCPPAPFPRCRIDHGPPRTRLLGPIRADRQQPSLRTQPPRHGGVPPSGAAAQSS
ncbi:hypothetical protein [Streptomyces sp. NPDC087859]|uniref:hypothetical protein n=1 Tax=Streptomyces sp. NPDC087859 TaxID=3365812 RepID=UPI00381BEFDE